MITLTGKAVSEIRRLHASKTAEPTAGEGAHLRVQVVGGGCSGMSYKLGFENATPTNTDKVFEKDGVKLIIDSKSFLYLTGTELDFSDGLNGKGFVFNNPNAKRTCGCGSSFST
ncbi:MAG: iron-sulfur cluster assembly accessory protein [Bdellovibrionales bacterium]|nr:iron-sulfur cluster assembly accessory protein [Bdellovibrionales bacterium]